MNLPPATEPNTPSAGSDAPIVKTAQAAAPRRGRTDVTVEKVMAMAVDTATDVIDY